MKQRYDSFCLSLENDTLFVSCSRYHSGPLNRGQCVCRGKYGGGGGHTSKMIFEH